MTQPPRIVPDRLRGTLELFVAAARSEGQIRAAWLEGSIARGTADDWSDIDLHLLVRSPFDVARWVSGVTPMVLVDAIPDVPGAFISLTPEWVHTDVVLHTDPDALRVETARWVLLDRDDAVHDTVTAAPDAGPPYFSHQQVRVFLYWMGAAVTAVRRNDLIVLAQTSSMMRDRLLPQLMLAENGEIIGPSGKRVTERLTPEQLAALGALPALDFTDVGLVRAIRAIATEYLARAHRLAETLSDDDWPTELEQATASLWARELDGFQ